MKDILKTAAATLAAFVLYSLLGRIDPSLLLVLNTFSLVVIFFSILKGELFGAVLGALCGLLQDSFSLGVFGVAGLSKTLLGFAAGYVSRKMNVVPFFRNFIFIFHPGHRRTGRLGLPLRTRLLQADDYRERAYLLPAPGDGGSGKPDLRPGAPPQGSPKHRLMHVQKRQDLRGPFAHPQEGPGRFLRPGRPVRLSSWVITGRSRSWTTKSIGSWPRPTVSGRGFSRPRAA